MIRFKDIPIQQKVTLVMLLASASALLLTCVAFVGYERVTFRRALVRDLTALADVVGQNCTAAIQFKNETDAANTLRALQANPSVTAAAVYTRDGTRFAIYARPDNPSVLPATPEAEGHRFERDRLVLFRPLLLDSKRIGTIGLQASLQELHDRMRTYGGIVVLVFVCAALLAVVISYPLQRMISRPILGLAETARIVKEQRNYSLRAPSLGHDEIGLLTDSFNQMLHDIETSQSALQEANRSLQAQSDQLINTAAILGSSSQQILSLSTQVAAAATESATAVAQTSATVEELRQTAQVSNQKAVAVSARAQQTEQISQRGRQSTEETLAGMNRIRQQMESIAESMVRLSEQTHAIGQIIATVEDLAAQSNLLAVNAAIEAAKAGEQGKGFSVVAQEVRNLADQSKQATAQVRGILNDIQKATSAAVMATEQGTHAVEAGLKQSIEAGDAIQLLSKSVTESAQAATQIAASSQQQLAGMEQVAAAMENIKNASNQNVVGARQLETAARHLNEVGQKLKAVFEQHKTRVLSA